MVVVDGSQAVPQIAVDLHAIDADFYAWTGHKAYGPTGIGVLHGRRELLEAMPPFIGGGHMIRTVGRRRVDLGRPALEVRGRHVADRRGDRAGRRRRLDPARSGSTGSAPTSGRSSPTRWRGWREFPGITLHGPADAADRGALISFVLDGAHPHDVGEILGREGVCVRTGHHCAQPLMRRLGVDRDHPGVVRRAQHAPPTSTG